MGQMRVRRTGPWVKISCPFSWVQFSSRWGQRLGQKKATRPNSNLRKAKVLEIRRFRGLLVRREGFEPPAFWSVGCLKGKSELFRLRFVRFTTVCSADFPLFPSSPACSDPILGQKWVIDSFVIKNFRWFRNPKSSTDNIFRKRICNLFRF